MSVVARIVTHAFCADFCAPVGAAVKSSVRIINVPVSRTSGEVVFLVFIRQKMNQSLLGWKRQSINSRTESAGTRARDVIGLDGLAFVFVMLVGINFDRAHTADQNLMDFYKTCSGLRRRP